MTARLVYNSVLVELTKVNAPSFLLEDFNYFVNKAINNYINRQYNIYDVNQQTTDNLRVLKSSAIIKDIKPCTGDDSPYGELVSGYYEFNLPEDYLHLLNCIVIYNYTTGTGGKCSDTGTRTVLYAAKRATSDMWSVVIGDYYNRPTPKRPYYFIHNVNARENISTNPYHHESDTYDQGVGTDMQGDYDVTVNENGEVVSTNSNFRRKINISSLLGEKETIDAVNKETAYRYGNASAVRCELRIGDDSKYSPTAVIVDYLKTPQYINLTTEQLDLIEDTSLIMEFPDYVCIEIINELELLFKENVADPRLQSSAAVVQTIASPAQQSSSSALASA